CCREYRHEHLGIGAGLERHGAGNEGIDGMVDADTDARARMPFGAALADDDVARNYGFAAELLDAEASASRIATVAGGTACFLVCHGASSLFLVGLGGLLGRRL